MIDTTGARGMTKQQRRERFPEVAAWVDDKLACFDGARVSYTKLPGYEFGIEGSAGVVPNVKEAQKCSPRKS